MNLHWPRRLTGAVRGNLAERFSVGGVFEQLAHVVVRRPWLVIGAWPADPGPAELTNREALARMAPLRAVLPAGAAALHRDQFEQMSAAGMDRDWLEELAG